MRMTKQFTKVIMANTSISLMYIKPVLDNAKVWMVCVAVVDCCNV